MYTFLNPYYFLLLVPILVLIYFMYFKSGIIVDFLPFEDIKKVYHKNSILYKLYYLIIFIIFILFITIFANFAEKNVKQIINKDWVDIEIVMDVSYSMNANDLNPNRLEVAKKVIKNYLEKLKTDRVWIVVFAWKPFTSIPLNFDYKVIGKIIDKININTIKQDNYYMQWTAIWDALILASDQFDTNLDREKVIILLTDWEANKWLDPMLAIDYIKEKKNKVNSEGKEGNLGYNKIKVYTIWIWWLEATYVMVPNELWLMTKVPISWVDEVTLKKISDSTWGEYFRATDDKTLENIFDTIWKLEKKEIKVDDIQIIKEKNIIFLYILIFFMLIFIFLKNKKFE